MLVVACSLTVLGLPVALATSELDPVLKTAGNVSKTSLVIDGGGVVSNDDSLCIEESFKYKGEGAGWRKG